MPRTPRPLHLLPLLAADAVALADATPALAQPGGATPAAAAGHASAKRPMSWIDLQTQQGRAFGGQSLSPAGEWLLYHRAPIDWKAGTQFGDAFLVSSGRKLAWRDVLALLPAEQPAASDGAARESR